MTDAAVGGLESAAEPQGPERITFPCFDGFRALAAIVVLVTHVAFLSGFNGRSRQHGGMQQDHPFAAPAVHKLRNGTARAVLEPGTDWVVGYPC